MRLFARAGAFLLHFFGALVVLTVVWTVAQQSDALHGWPPLARRMLAFGVIAASLGFAVWKARAVSPPRRSAAPSPDAARFAERLGKLSRPTRAAAAPPARLPEAIARAARQAIVFRQLFPPPIEAPPLSFWGGAPVAPPDFVWPRTAGGAALSFVLQIDCADVPAAGRLDLLPDTGVLYVFTDLEWGEWACRVVHVDRPDATWRPVAPPADLKPVYGLSEGRYAAPWAGPDAADLPRLLPKWPFRPTVIAVEPEQPEDGDECADPPYWPGGTAVAAALLAAEGDPELAPRFDAEGFVTADGALVRPFATYPHDWRAVQILAATVRDEAVRARRHATWLYRDLPADQRTALLDTIAAAAADWKARADASPRFAAVPAAESDRVWDGIARHAALARFCLAGAVTQSVEASLTASAAAAARIPAEVAARLRWRHVLAVRSGDGIHARTPDRMLAAPSYVQGSQGETAVSQLLLLELSSDDGLGHRLGDGVIQFWITPDDLRHRRFERTIVTGDAY